MSCALAVVDKSIVVAVEAEPNTLFVNDDGKVIVLFPVASCLTINVP